MKVKHIHGGRHFKDKMCIMGLREGTEIKKISSQMMRGPIAIKVGQTQIAIGYNMAKKIIVE